MIYNPNSHLLKFNPYLKGKVVLGGTVTFDSAEWVVQHVDGKYAILGLNGLGTRTIYYYDDDKETSKYVPYGQSDLKTATLAWQNANISAGALAFCADVTVDGVTAKVFPPTETQLTSTWSWPSQGAANRIVPISVGHADYWTCSQGANDSTCVCVTCESGNIQRNIITGTAGHMRPFVKVRFKK